MAIPEQIQASQNPADLKGIPQPVIVEQVIDGSVGAYTAGDVVGADDCCSTLAIPWRFDLADIIRPGGSGHIIAAELFNETENLAVQYDLLLFNATPTGDLRDNAANDNPLKGDKNKSFRKIEFQYSVAKGSTVATTTEATPSTVGGLSKPFICAKGDTKLYGVLVTNTAYTQTAGDVIRITLWVVPF